jgi:hypothetical protein
MVEQKDRQGFHQGTDEKTCMLLQLTVILQLEHDNRFSDDGSNFRNVIASPEIAKSDVQLIEVKEFDFKENEGSR